MSVHYSAVGWNRQKRVYDSILWGGILSLNAIYVAAQLFFFPAITAETLILRATSITAILLLHFILYIGPLCRVNRRYNPLLYNRRHAGVTMFLFALIHSSMALIQYHALGNVHPIKSLFFSNLNYDQLHHFPFQVLGFYGLMILMVMALTSHDFWLKNLGAKNWKRLHRLVYVAYALLLAHIALGIYQEEKHFIYTVALVLSASVFCILHTLAFWKKMRNRHVASARNPERFADSFEQEQAKLGWIRVCSIDDIRPNGGKEVIVQRQPIAIFRYGNQISAVHGRCKHQGGPLAEGKVIDGCITCPWHGYQYFPNNGQSPPPFTETIKTYAVKVIHSNIWLNPKSPGMGVHVEPASILSGSSAASTASTALIEPS